MGDAAFVNQLNAVASVAAGGWGTVAAAWDGSTFDQARRAAPGHELRTRLAPSRSSTMRSRRTR